MPKTERNRSCGKSWTSTARPHTCGAEPIEWEIIGVDGTTAYLWSKEVLDCMPYHTVRECVLWETSSIRSWLNDDFYNTAFTQDEQAAILKTTIINEENQGYGVDSGNDTEDYVFLPSVEEVLDLYNIDIYTACAKLRKKPTETAVANGISVLEEEQAKALGSASYTENAGYWLRVSDYLGFNAPYVLVQGKINETGIFVDFTRFGVRPAVKVDITKINS